MRTRINCFGVTDGSQTFQIITYKPPLKAVKEELEAVFKQRKVEFPKNINWYFKYDNLITAIYESTEDGFPIKVKLDFKIEYI